MLLRVKSHTAAALAALLLFASVAPSPAAQKKSKKKPAPRGTPVLWRETDPGQLDISAGPGGRGMRPAARGLRFVKEEKGGWSKKFRVRDANGREWVAKVSREAQ